MSFDISLPLFFHLHLLGYSWVHGHHPHLVHRVFPACFKHHCCFHHCSLCAGLGRQGGREAGREGGREGKLGLHANALFH